MNAPIDWLLAGEPWVEYRTRCDLLGQSADDPQVCLARRQMLAHPQVQSLVAALAQWSGTVIASHKSAGQPFHKLTFIADLGLTAGDNGVDAIVAHIMEHQAAEGPFQLHMNIASHYGGTGTDIWAWALCDAPLIIYALVTLGLENDLAVRKAINYLVERVSDNGWPCVVAKELGSFRGPGRKDDPCPFATMAMLKALSVIENMREDAACHMGAQALLNCWRESRTRHPYMFFMGTDFRKLKAPFVWYDLLHLLDVLTRFKWLHNDAQLLEMLALLKSKADPEGKFTAESVWTAWKDWEFGQKKTPSRWLTLMAWRIINRVDGATASA